MIYTAFSAVRGACVSVEIALHRRQAGRVPATRGRAVALRGEPPSKAQRLAPSGGHPSRGLAATLRARWRAGCRRTAASGALPVRSPMQRSRLRLHRDAEQPSQAGGAGVDDDIGPFPCPGIAGLVSFTLRVNEARLTNWPAFRSRRCASFAARQPDRHPGHPPCPMPGR